MSSIINSGPLTTNASSSPNPYYTGVIVGADSIFIHAQKADNGYVLHASMNAPAGQTARSFTRVVPADGDLVGELAALIATLKIS